MRWNGLLSTRTLASFRRPDHAVAIFVSAPRPGHSRWGSPLTVGEDAHNVIIMNDVYDVSPMNGLVCHMTLIVCPFSTVLPTSIDFAAEPFSAITSANKRARIGRAETQQVNAAR
jgi:hypothetical protein